jgi:hypothetical protein
MNLNRHFAIDTNLNVTPAASGETTNISGGHATEFLAGARAEIRARRYGFYLKAQPGVFIWSNVIKQVVFPTPSTFTFIDGSQKRFVSDVGAGFEYSPSARVHVRAEVTDLVMRYSSSSWSNNLQPTAGVYFGLGKPIAWTPPVYDARSTHPFFNTTNIVLITGSVLGMTADSITTQRFIERGLQEGDPIARPLVKYGWSGQISLQIIETSAELLGMYALHRIGQHWVERLIPVSLATTHAIFAYNNTKISYSTPAN